MRKSRNFSENMEKHKLENFAGIISESSNIVFFGGAGVSTESGIPDFRSPQGVFADRGELAPEEIVSHRYFLTYTDKFYEFYRERMLFPNAKPNAAHMFVAKLEKVGKLKAVVTQNIDGLHQAAGSKNVYELHGSVHRNYCMRCGKFFGLDQIVASKGVPRCDCGGVIKPDVVLYGEQLDGDVISGSVNAISKADTLVIGGTSLVVYPAASFIEFFGGKHLVIINKSQTFADDRAELTFNDKIGEVFSALDEMKII